MPYRLKHAVAALCAAAAALLAPASHGQDFPSRPLRLVVPSAPGGSPDTVMRLLAQEAARRLGQPVVVENKPGSSGIAGILEVYRAAPDGYTLGYANNVTLAINRSTFAKLPYDPRELKPVVFVLKVANILAVNPEMPVRSLAEFVDYARRHPDEVTYASPGQGTSGHLTGELLAQSSGLKMVHVPYRGSPAATTDVIGGQVDAIFDNTISITPHIRSGKLRPLAITSLRRSPQFPDLPTVAESALPGFEGVAWGGIVAPPGTPDALIDRLNRCFNEALADPAVRSRLMAIGNDEIVGGPPQALFDYAERETAKWAGVVRAARLPVQ
ncbi:tripartite tricarboxylate transporter substrate binding protein [Achromobacter sp. Marseille-Q4962]|jgi:tripartite-type tricarboxylate transporter receptor subunit TctC|uniref:Bug family tripartite tricarboxylate transporter substrate binding protein n=1 Tax=Achromobacter sp. Marseille-Q4962 TaxID=2942202 RepID=UPI002074A29B|nr:tripartite tricarboxylate transporter substrate binding protein [Achromobacter sp. Marseille-Q4962]